MRILALAIFLAAACSAPCPLVCQSDLECPQAFFCLNNAACLPDCLRCNGECAETVSNCGACNAPCGGATPKCVLGTNSVPTHCASACNPGTNDCNGSCYNLSNDSFHCGSCANACNRDEVCVNSVCTRVDTCQ